MERLTTSEVAKQGGVNLETVRYYERRGLLPKPPRTPTGHRAFAPEAVRRLRFIRHAQALGFFQRMLKQVQELLSVAKFERRTIRPQKRATNSLLMHCLQVVGDVFFFNFILSELL